MFKNLVSFLLVALVAVQASPRYTFDLEEKDFQTYINISDIIQKIIEEIENIVGNANVEEIIEKIIEFIKKILGETTVAYGNPKECLEQQKPRIKEIAEEAKAGVTACAEDAKAKLEPLKAKAEEIRAKAATLVKDSAEKIKACLKGDNKWKCIKEVREEMAAGIKEIEGEALALREQAEGIVKDAKACVNGVREETAAKVKEVLEKIRACIKGQYLIDLF